MDFRVGFFSSKQYFNRNAFSGVLFSMHAALRRRGLTVVDLGNPQRHSGLRRVMQQVLATAARCPVASGRFHAQVQTQLASLPCDILFAPVASTELAGFDTGLPVVLASDATPTLLRDTYAPYPDEVSYQRSVETERTVIKRAQRLIYSSQWAADSAISDYGADPNRIRILPFGANAEFNGFENALERRLVDSTCRLMFVGKDWFRKGGETAIRTLDALEQRGIPAALTVIGAEPPAQAIGGRPIRVRSFLDKNRKHEKAEFNALFAESHFLLLPSRAECFGVVNSEASAFGVPVLANGVGGIPSAITNGRNGYVLPAGSTGEDYATRIESIFNNTKRYAALARSSRDEFETRLNWDTWALQMERIFEETLAEAAVAA